MKPGNAEELLEAVQWAVREAVPLEVVGGGTKRVIGRPMQVGHQLDLSGLAGIRLYEPEELVLTAGAGTPLDEIEAALAERGQHLAFEPPDYGELLGSVGRPTLGGVIVANLAGPRRLTGGAPRDHLLGFSGVNGRGEAFKAGGRVVKNVTGYDLAKLLTGSWGTLAALAEVTVKVLPRPEASATVVIEGLDAAAAVRAMSRAMNSPHDVSAAAWLSHPHPTLPRLAGEGLKVATIESSPAMLTPSPAPAGEGRGGGASSTMLRLEGPSPSVISRRDALVALLSDCGPITILDAEATIATWHAIRDVAPFAADRTRFVWKISVPPSAGAAIVSAFPEGEAMLDWAGGLVWLALPPSPDGAAARVRAAVAPHGGHATLIRADAATRADVPVLEPLPAPLAALSRRVKESFDPHFVLNPGRLYAGS